MLLPALGSSQLIVEENGALGIGTDTVSGAQLFLSNPGHTYGMYLRTGRRDTDHNYTGIYNEVERGGGERLGVWNEIQTTNGDATGMTNRTAAGPDHAAFGIQNKVSGEGSRTGIYNYIRDTGHGNPTKPFAGLHTYIQEIQNRERAYGTRIEIRNEDSHSGHRAYGLYVHFSKSPSNPQASTSYGVYSKVPKAKDYAGYFDGNVTVTGNFINTSDARLKTAADTIASPLQTIMALRPRQYRFRADNRFSYDGERLHYGFMAQDVEAVLPSLVHEVAHPAVMEAVDVADDADDDFLNKDDRGLLDVEDPDGNGLVSGIADTTRARGGIPAPAYRVVHEAETLKGVRYTDLIAVLTGAVQEQQALIEGMRRRLTELEAELAVLRDCTQCDGGGGGPITTPGGGLGAAAGAQGDGTTDESSTGLSVFPNPTAGGVTVSHVDLSGYELRVLGSDGREVLSRRVEGHTVLLDTRGWAAGTYVVEAGGQRRTLVVR